MDRDAARFAIANAVALAFTGLGLVWLSRDGAVDFMVSRYFADAGAGGFPLQDAALLSRAGHTGLRWVALTVWTCALVLAAASFRAASLRRWRGALTYFCIAAAGTTALVAMLKSASAHSCPWDLDAFGGAYTWFPLFDAPAGDPGPGRCWPGGHAAGGFALIAGYFSLRDANRVRARVALAFALAMGSAMSVVQVARGAHFLSHNLWSLWLAWLCSLAGYLVWRSFAEAPH